MPYDRECEKWFIELNLVRLGGKAKKSEDLFKPSDKDVRKAAEVFWYYGGGLYEGQMDEAETHVTEELKHLKYSDPLLATVFYTIDSGPINPVMRDLWDKKFFLNFNDKEKFAIAASVLIQRYILEKPLKQEKWNLKRMTKGKLSAENLMPFRSPTSFAIVEQEDFGSYKTILRTRVGRDISDVSYYPGEAEVLLPIGYSGIIIKLGEESTVAHSKDVDDSSESTYKDPNSVRYQDKPTRSEGSMWTNGPSPPKCSLTPRSDTTEMVKQVVLLGALFGISILLSCVFKRTINLTKFR